MNTFILRYLRIPQQQRKLYACKIKCFLIHDSSPWAGFFTHWQTFRTLLLMFNPSCKYMRKNFPWRYYCFCRGIQAFLFVALFLWDSLFPQNGDTCPILCSGYSGIWFICLNALSKLTVAFSICLRYWHFVAGEYSATSICFLFHYMRLPIQSSRLFL